MERTQRIARINMLARRRQGVTMAQLLEDMEVSRATINRDLQYMRDQMHAPIIWDCYSYCYRLDQAAGSAERYMLPGLWLTPAQAYAYLTLHNMVEKIAPGLLGPFLDPMRMMLKQMLGDADFPLYGLDRKIDIEMPDMPSLSDLDFNNLMEALLYEQPLVLELDGVDGMQTLSGRPAQLKITANGWLLGMQDTADMRVQWLDVTLIKKARLLDERP